MLLKQTLNLLLIILVILLIALMAAGTYIGFQYTKPLITSTVQESVEKKLSPSEAKVSFSVIGKDKSQAIATANNQKYTQDVNQTLKTKFNIPVNDIRTTQSSNNNPISYDDKGHPLEKEWAVSTNYQVTLKDLDKNKDTLELMNSEFSNNLNGVEYYNAGDYKITNILDVCDELEYELMTKLSSKVPYGEINLVSVNYQINKDQCINSNGGWQNFNSAADAKFGGGVNTEAFLGEQKVVLSGQATIQVR